MNLVHIQLYVVSEYSFRRQAFCPPQNTIKIFFKVKLKMLKADQPHFGYSMIQGEK